MEKYNIYRVGNPFCKYKSKLHDKALKRALTANCMIQLDKCKPQVETVPHRTLFVYNLNYETTEETLKRKFERFGDIITLYIVTDILKGTSKGYGFIEYASSYNAEIAYNVLAI